MEVPVKDLIIWILICDHLQRVLYRPPRDLRTAFLDNPIQIIGNPVLDPEGHPGQLWRIRPLFNQMVQKWEHAFGILSELKELIFNVSPKLGPFIAILDPFLFWKCSSSERPDPVNPCFNASLLSHWTNCYWYPSLTEKFTSKSSGLDISGFILALNATENRGASLTFDLTWKWEKSVPSSDGHHKSCCQQL